MGCLSRLLSGRPVIGTPRRPFSAIRRPQIETLESRLALDSTVVLSEIMYHPAGDNEQLEWIELHNQMAVDMDLSAWRLTAGVEYEFPEGTVVPGGGWLVVAKDPEALDRSGAFASAMGPYRGQLSNQGETIELRDRNDRLMDSVRYDDQAPWPVAASGSGASLAKLDPASSSGPAANWTFSRQIGGTPGRGTDALPELPALSFNEIAPAGTDAFWFELVNRGDTPVQLGGLVAVSSAGPTHVLADRTIPPTGLAVIDQSELGFSVAAGDRIDLIDAARTHVLASATVDTVLRGRSPAGEGPWFFPAAPTPGAANAFQFHDQIVINEILYHAAPSGGTETVPFRQSDEEWLELFNRSDQTVDVTGWSIEQAVDYAFPGGTTIPPGGYLVVARDPEALRGSYPSIAERIVGPYTGSLGDRSDQIVLVDAAGNRADEVTYFDNGKWPAAADGGGSSLELTDPLADNRSALAWSASREGEASAWRSYTYQGVATPSSVGPDGQFHELILGLLDRGEVLLDDIRVTQDPGGAAIDLIQNGSFDADPVGGTAGAWRIIGNHRHSQVIPDPDDPANRVLRLVATGPTEHMHNHAETTLKAGDTFVPIVDGATYRISFRAKWISGSNQLNTRLYFNRLARTTRIERPDRHGTPGRPNSTRVTNLGPTIDQVRHEPAVPAADQPVTVTASAADPQGVARMTLWYSAAGGPWMSVPMTEGDPGHYAAQLPGQSAATIVQFYVVAEDADGAGSTFPRAGAGARALYQVDDGLAVTGGRHNLRIIMTAADADFLHSPVELMSNDLVGATVVYDEQQVFYDVGVRLAGSERGRPVDARLSFNIAFPSDQLFRGVHRTIKLDRSQGIGFGQREILYHHGATHAGGLPTEYNDLVHIITPRLVHTGSAELQASRYTNVFLDSQFKRGGEGTLYEYELIYYPTTTVDGTPEGRKVPAPDTVQGTSLRSLGADQEAYRWNFLKKNLRQADDYSRLIEFLSVMGSRGAAFTERIGQVIDVDQWLRAFAFTVITGAGDNYGSDGAAHNLQLYVRPSDQKVLFLPHDLDAFFSTSRPLVGNSDLARLLTVPEYAHMYYGHVDDMLRTTFNKDYMGSWTHRFGQLVPEQQSAFSVVYLRDIQNREHFLHRSIVNVAPKVEFDVSAPGPIDAGAEKAITVTGSGWVDVREIRLAGSETPLPVTWTGVTDWQATVPIDRATGELTFEAFDFQGRRIGHRSVAVRSSAPVPVDKAIRITELFYHPLDPTADELARAPDLKASDFEFIELANTSDDAVELAGIHFTRGIDFTAGHFELGAGQRVVVVRNLAAFRLRFGDSAHVVGPFAGGKLSNGGETIELVDADGGLIERFTYDDAAPWPSLADGRGPSLEVVGDRNDLDNPDAWRSSAAIGGTPGQAGSGIRHDVVINEVGSGDDGATASIELKNTTGQAVDVSGWYLSDRADDLLLNRLPAGVIVPARGYRVLPASTLAHGPAAPISDGLWLTAAEPATGRPLRIVDRAFFEPIEVFPRSTSLGRWPNGSAAGDLVPLEGPSLGAANRRPVAGAVVISEVHYRPKPYTGFRHDFDQGTAEGFAPRLGNWSVEAGRYLVTPGPESDTASLVANLPAQPGHYTLAATVVLPEASPFNRNAALLFDYRGPTDFKFASLHASSGKLRIGARDATGWHFLAEIKAGVPADTDLRMAVRIRGSVATLLLQGVTWLEYDFGDRLNGGAVGLGTKGGTARFDDVELSWDDSRGDFEFVELSNTTSAAIDLTHWRLAGDIALTFPANTTLDAGASLVVTRFDPGDTTRQTLFRNRWDVDPDVTITGPFRGRLSDGQGVVRLVRPTDALGGASATTLVDLVRYASDAPWPEAANGQGPSLSRGAADGYGGLATSFLARPPSPGSVHFVPAGDLDMNGAVDANDADDFAVAVTDPAAYEAAYTVPGTLAGDADRDGDVDFDDIIALLALLRIERG